MKIWINRTAGGVLCCALLAMAATVVDAKPGKEDLKEAAKSLNETFKGTSFTAKVNLSRYGHHYVMPNGEPHPSKGKKQGRGGEGAIQFDSGIKVHAGEVGYTIGVHVKGKDQVMVFFNKKPNAKLNPATAHVLYDRPVTADDLTPEKIAVAVQSLVEIKGYEPSAQVAAAFDEALASGSEASTTGQPAPDSPTAPMAPTVISVEARAEPPTVHGGEEVALVLEYEVAAPSGSVTAVETRSLSLDGRMMPTYPVHEEIQRQQGVFISSYRQMLPRTVATGSYVFKGEVCVGGDCISRSVHFEVVRP